MADRPDRSGGFAPTDGEVIGLGVLAVVGLAAVLIGRSSTGSSNPTSSSFSSNSSIPPAECPGCGLYITPDGKGWAVDGNGVSYWVETPAAWAACGYNGANAKHVSDNAIAGCTPGVPIASCGQCPCDNFLFDWCADVPCPGCL